jgi:hypothetical protein
MRRSYTLTVSSAPKNRHICHEPKTCVVNQWEQQTVYSIRPSLRETINLFHSTLDT